jgi:hypothetical protein
VSVLIKFKIWEKKEDFRLEFYRVEVFRSNIRFKSIKSMQKASKMHTTILIISRDLTLLFRFLDGIKTVNRLRLQFNCKPDQKLIKCTDFLCFTLIRQFVLK